MSKTVVGKQSSVLQIEGLKCAFVGIVFFFFLNRNLGSHSWITLLRVVAWIQVFFFFFVSSDTRIPEDTRAQHLRGPPSSCFLGATHNLMLQDHTLMLQECSVPRKTTEATGVPSPAS